MSPQHLCRPPAPRSASRRVRLGAALTTAIAIVFAAAGCGMSAQPRPAPIVANPPAPGTPTDPAALNAADVNAWLDGLLPAALQRTGIAGATVAVVDDGEILTARGYGHADTGDGGTGAVPVDPDRHLFRVGSVAKLFTATAAMQLVQRGDLDLDRNIEDYLDFTLPRRYEQPITLRHLLTHTPASRSGSPG